METMVEICRIDEYQVASKGLNGMGDFAEVADLTPWHGRLLKTFRSKTA